MRPATRLLAKFLEPGAPTGLAGLITHPAPRSTLIYLYSSTLAKLQQVPAHSPYRQATEALTRKRLQAVESIVPEGYEAWSEKVRKAVETHRGTTPSSSSGSKQVALAADAASTHSPTSLKFEGREFVLADLSPFEVDWQKLNPADQQALPEGGQSEEIKVKAAQRAAKDQQKQANKPLKLEPEPRLSVEQYVMKKAYSLGVHQLETALAAGLIEEAIEVANGEHRLADVMIENKVWEELCEKPVEGQWSYFERTSRNTHVPMTQAHN